ncbi:hypothetical protein, partial [Metabacillus rhizolycopersici]
HQKDGMEDYFGSFFLLFQLFFTSLYKNRSSCRELKGFLDNLKNDLLKQIIPNLFCDFLGNSPQMNEDRPLLAHFIMPFLNLAMSS